MKTFFAKLKAAFEKVFGSTTWEKTALGVISFIAPLLETIVGLAAGGPAEALVAKVISIVQSDLSTLQTVVSDATSATSTSGLQTAQNALNSIKTNLSSLLTAAQIKNSTKAADITAAVNTVVGEVDAILENMPTATNAPTS
jgi:hypothetical protein